MPKFTVTFHKWIQDSQEFGSTDEHMVSRVFFSLDVDGKGAGDFTADLKQAVGSEFNDANIEVGPPNGYDAPFDHEGFSRAARNYISGWIGPGGRAIKVQGSTVLRMRNNTYYSEAKYDL